jgi:hypothetical protein
MECAVLQAIWKSYRIFLQSLLQLSPHLNMSSSKAAAAAATADQLVRSILHQSRRYKKFSPTTFSTAIQLSISIINVKLGSNRNVQLANLSAKTLAVRRI